MKFNVAVDRIEDNALAVIEAEGIPGVIEWPTALLPKGTRDGDVLVFRIEADPAERDRRREEIRRTVESLSRRKKPQGE